MLSPDQISRPSGAVSFTSIVTWIRRSADMLDVAWVTVVTLADRMTPGGDQAPVAERAYKPQPVF